MLMAQYNKLVAYLEEKEFHGDSELEALVDRLGSECQEAEEATDSANEALNEMPSGVYRTYYGE